MTEIEIPRPQSGDVVDLILEDHRLFEDLMRRLRDETQDRVAVRATLADVLVAHAEAEEQHVYPALVRKDAIDDEDAEHGEREHDEGHEALLALLEVDDVSSEDFGEALEELTTALAHHLDEEERDILNPARTEVPDDTRAELGRRFAGERATQLEARCGELDNVRRLVERARQRAGD
ncbi:MAG: hemerythrin domain-containing protein [Actinomycetes bacterium]